MMQGDPGDELIIRLASPADIGHIVSIDDDACALFDSDGAVHTEQARFRLAA
jgi:hypothetical protein